MDREYKQKPYPACSHESGPPPPWRGPGVRSNKIIRTATKIPACAGMTVRVCGDDGKGVRNDVMGARNDGKGARNDGKNAGMTIRMQEGPG
jgi:hypothetical protein